MAKTGSLIKLGYEIPIDNGRYCSVKAFLGGGGQGEVYRVSIDRNEFALKWYFDRCQTMDLKNSLQNLIAKGAPSKAFLWPKSLIEHMGRFGYVMDLRPTTYEKSQGILSRKLNLSYNTVSTACIQLADAFRQLHVAGLSYQDISWGNVFINPSTGDVLVCDNDNVAPHGASVAGIAGTMGFMAPEIVRGEARPDSYTDLFSLAVLMFRMLFIEHPFDGRRFANEECLDQEFSQKIYGTNPIFIFDPNNDKNRPDPNTQGNAALFWDKYPQYLRDLFTTAFTKGLTDRENGRPLEQVWIDAFRRIKETVFPCPYCGVSIVYDEDVVAKGGIKCFKCKKKLPLPPRIKIVAGRKTRTIVLNPDTKIRTYQINPTLDVKKGDVPVAEMAQNPNNPSSWGLRNLMSDNWFYTVSGGEEKSCAPGRAIVLNKGLNINFGNATGETLV
jgi:serine/threonine protein kinase